MYFLKSDYTICIYYRKITKVKKGGTEILNFATINIHEGYFYVFTYFNQENFKYLKSCKNRTVITHLPST